MSTRTILAERLVDKSATSPPSNPATSGETVTVACKIASGLRIAAHVWQEYDEPGPTMSKRAKRAVEVASFVLNGPNSTLPLGMPSRAGVFPMLATSGGYALTPGVPKDLWDRWFEDNRNSDMVRGRLVFCASTEDRAKDESRELQNERSGFEPLEVGNPGDRIPDKRIGRDRLNPASWEGRR